MQRRFTWHIALIGAGLMALLLTGIVVVPRLLYPPLPSTELRNVPTVKERIELQQAQSALQNDARTPLLQGLGGLLLVAGVLATWQQVLIGREGQITERFTRAIDQLGSDKLDVRLGGLFALERIAKNSMADREPITRILEAFVRTHAPWPAGSPESAEARPTPAVDQNLPWLRDRAPDVQVCLIVLGRRVALGDKRAHLPLVDLRHSYLSRAQLARSELQYSNLARARMRAIHLEGSVIIHADLRQANLQGALLTRADLVDSQAPAGDLDAGGRGLDPAADAGQLELPGLGLGWDELAVGGTPRQRFGVSPVGQAVPVRRVDHPGAPPRSAGVDGQHPRVAAQRPDRDLGRGDA